MNSLILLLAAIFLPLFPLSMVFNLLFARLGNGMLRSVLLLLWPQLGLVLVMNSDVTLPVFIPQLALITSLLYAFRALTLRDVGQWSSFLATSLWALLWFGIVYGEQPGMNYLHAAGMSVPLLLLTLLGGVLQRRFGAAYTGLYGGLALTMPRFSGVLVFVVLAIIATPLFPGFFSMLTFIVDSLPVTPMFATVLLLIWLLWSWAGARLLHGLIVGPARAAGSAADLGLAATWGFTVVLVVLLAGGWYSIGGTL